MKQGLDVQHTLVHGCCHNSNTIKGSFSKYLIVLMPAFFLLFITGYKNEQAQITKNHLTDSATRQEVKIRWVPSKGSFKAMVEMTLAGVSPKGMQQDNLKGIAIESTSNDYYKEAGVTMLFPAKPTSMGSYRAAKPDSILTIGSAYVQANKYSGVFIYLL